MVPTYSMVESSYLTASYERTSRVLCTPTSLRGDCMMVFYAVTRSEECYIVDGDGDPRMCVGSKPPPEVGSRSHSGPGGGGVLCSHEE